MQTFKTSKARENILRRIRTGLKDASLPMPFPEAEKQDMGQVFATDRLSAEEVFANAFNKLGGKFIFCASEQELADSVRLLYDQREWSQLLCADNKLLSLFRRHNLSFVGQAHPKIPGADACITGCEFLVARTGSALISSGQLFGRTAPVYYPTHIIVAYTSQLVRDIQDGIDALTAKYGDSLPSMINLNTGPSRTADIEKTLVVGVHGPGEVFCFLIDDSM